jgi:hypothetical protein
MGNRGQVTRRATGTGDGRHESGEQAGRAISVGARARRQIAAAVRPPSRRLRAQTRDFSNRGASSMNSARSAGI